MAKVDESELEPSHRVSEADLEGEPGHPGVDPYKDAHAPQPAHLAGPTTGGLGDVAKSWANSMAFGAAPELEGAAGAIADSAVKPVTEGRPQSNEELLAAYKGLRDEGKKQHDASDDTTMGKVGQVLAMLTPHPLLPSPAPGASIPKRIGLGAATGAGVGAISGAANSPADLTTGDAKDAKRMLLDTSAGLIGGGLTGGAVAGGMAMAQNPVRRLAEEQALRAAGLRGGIKNSIQKDLGIENMDEARELGRKFLDQGLIPLVGSSEAVAARAEKLQSQAGNAVGSTLDQFEVGGHQFDYPEAAAAMRKPIMDPAQTTAVARQQAGKALDLADTIGMDQALDTPGSIIGANRAKSDAWKAARFDDDPDLAAATYRKAVSGLRGNIENQVSRALGPDTAGALAKANQQYGVAADALKLANNASTRDAAKKGITMGDLLALTGGTAAGGATGHPIAIPAATAAAVIGHKAFDRWGHSTAARAADALANQFAESSGGHVGGVGGQSLVNRLAPWEEFLKKDEEK